MPTLATSTLTSPGRESLRAALRLSRAHAHAATAISRKGRYIRRAAAHFIISKNTRVPAEMPRRWLWVSGSIAAAPPVSLLLAEVGEGVDADAAAAVKL